MSVAYFEAQEVTAQIVVVQWLVGPIHCGRSSVLGAHLLLAFISCGHLLRALICHGITVLTKIAGEVHFLIFDLLVATLVLFNFFIF